MAAAAGSDDLAEEIAELAAHLDSATHRLLACIRAFDDSGDWERQGAVSCAHWLSWRIGLDLVTAREKVRVARTLGTLPAIDRALACGELSYAKVRAITRVATPATEAALLQYARAGTGAQLERICRRYRQVVATQEGGAPAEDRSVRERVLPSGMVKVELVLTPDEAAVVLKAIEQARHTLAAERPGACDDSAEASRDPGKPDQPEQPDHARIAAAAPATLADAAVLIAETYLHGQPLSAASNTTTRHQLFVHLDQDVLAPDGNWGATLDDGTRLSPETLRRIACDAALVATRTDATGATVDIGRRTRAIPPALRRALWLRDRGCRFPGCTHTRFLHGHHLQHWLHGGSTSLANLILLCSRHHRLVHEGGFRIVVHDSEEGALAFETPQRKPMFAVPRPVEVENAVTNLRIWGCWRRAPDGGGTGATRRQTIPVKAARVPWACPRGQGGVPSRADGQVRVSSGPVIAVRRLHNRRP